MNKVISLGLVIGLIAASCTDPNTIGLEIQPTSDNIIISSANFEGLTSETESEDSLRTDEALSLILGNISDDPTFAYNHAGFYTQILLTENNTDLGDNPIVDSVIMSYTYSGYYGDLQDFYSISMQEMAGSIYKDSTYYSTTNIEGFSMPYNFIESFNIDTDSEENPVLKMNLQDNLGQKILDLGSEILKDNESFLENFYGLGLSAAYYHPIGVEVQNTMLYLNPEGSNSFFKIHYHNNESGTDTLSLDFELGGDAARINLFNSKPLSNLNQEDGKVYIQSMAGYKAKIAVNNTDSIKAMLQGKAINKVTMTFDVGVNSQSKYAAHDKLFLVRVNNEGNNVFLSDYTIEGETHFGGNLENEKYEFNITRYFYQLLNNSSYTNDLYLLPAGAAVNANRTILEKDITLTIYYSQL